MELPFLHTPLLIDQSMQANLLYNVTIMTFNNTLPPPPKSLSLFFSSCLYLSFSFSLSLFPSLSHQLPLPPSLVKPCMLNCYFTVHRCQLCRQTEPVNLMTPYQTFTCHNDYSANTTLKIIYFYIGYKEIDYIVDQHHGTHTVQVSQDTKQGWGQLFCAGDVSGYIAHLYRHTTLSECI